MNNKTNKVVASKYVIQNGQVLHELVCLGRGKYIVAVNGQIPDARKKLTADDARDWYDAAVTQIGPRP